MDTLGLIPAALTLLALYCCLSEGAAIPTVLIATDVSINYEGKSVNPLTVRYKRESEPLLTSMRSQSASTPSEAPTSTLSQSSGETTAAATDTTSPIPKSTQRVTTALPTFLPSTTSKVHSSTRGSTRSASSAVPKGTPTPVTKLTDEMTTPSAPLTGLVEEATTESPATTTQNMSITETYDDRKYYTVAYTSSATEGRSYWRDIGAARTHQALEGHRIALQLVAGWNFTFYGHDVNRFTLAVGGFVYMSPFLHKYLSATQYIAPLMANFDTTPGPNAGTVYFASQSDAVIFEWRDVHLRGQEEAGGFTFQVQLFKTDGKIVFAYKQIPIAVKDISTSQHSVKAGIADAYYHDVGFRRIIYEYHNVELDLDKITTDSAVIFTHKTTCNLHKDCKSCHSANLVDFECHWCESVKRCSDSLDRFRQQWLINSCPLESVDRETCMSSTTKSPTPKTTPRSSVSSTSPSLATSSTPGGSSAKTAPIKSSYPQSTTAKLDTATTDAKFNLSTVAAQFHRTTNEDLTTSTTTPVPDSVTTTSAKHLHDKLTTNTPEAKPTTNSVRLTTSKSSLSTRGLSSTVPSDSPTATTTPSVTQPAITSRTKDPSVTPQTMLPTTTNVPTIPTAPTTAFKHQPTTPSNTAPKVSELKTSGAERTTSTLVATTASPKVNPTDDSNGDADTGTSPQETRSSGPRHESTTEVSSGTLMAKNPCDQLIKDGTGTAGCSSPNSLGQQQVKGGSGKKGTTTLAIGLTVGLVLAVAVTSIIILYIYSYKHPTSIPGQFLIKYRPAELGRRWKGRQSKEDTYRVGAQTLSNEAYEGEIGNDLSEY